MTGVRARALPSLLMAASGFAGLGYQIVWTQQGALWLGHEAAAVLAVIAAFFGGLAFGALVLGARVARSMRPVRWYAACEVVIGAWSLALILLMAPVNAWLQRLTGVPAAAAWQWGVAFVGTFVLLLPATAAMGATLPALERTLAAGRHPNAVARSVTWHRAHAGGSSGSGLRPDPGIPASIAALYAANTFGAVLGVIANAFWLVPTFGLARTAVACGALNLLCAAGALIGLPRRAPAAPAVAAGAPSTARIDGAPLVRLFFTGLLGIGFEVLVVRVLSQVCEDTVYTFAAVLAVYLVGSALGAAAYARWAPRARDAAALGDRLLALLAIACLLGTASLWAADGLHAALVAGQGGMARALAGEATLALAAFGLPTVAMGALFSHLAGAAGGASLGRALGVNTLGAALAPALFGVVAAPSVGPAFALLAIAAGYLALTSRTRWKRPAVWVPAFATAAFAAWAPPLVIVDVPQGGRIVRYDEGVTAAVSVVEDADGVARLRIDNREQEGSGTSGFVDGRMALLPVLLHPAPRSALFLGLGTGVTAASATFDRRLRVDAVELVPGVIAASPLFTARLAGTDASRLHVLAADARRYVRAPGPSYDVIVSDNFHPARSGSGALYTIEHFEAVRARLAPGGLFCQWLPLHQIDLDTTRSIVRAFLSAFPHGQALLASHSLDTPVIGLVGRADDDRFDAARVRARLAPEGLAVASSDFGLDDELALLGSFVAGPAALGRFAGGAPANTDDRPIVAYRAPLAGHGSDGRPRDRLVALLHELGASPGEIVEPTRDGVLERRLAAYWSARDRFVEIGRDAHPVANAGAMLAQVGEPLLDVLRTSPDFRPAYDPLLRMGVSLARSDPAGGAALLQALARVQPARPEAMEALREIGVRSPT